MTKLLRVLSACLALAAAGCIDIEQTLVMEKDGSGSLEISYSISEQSITQVKSMLKLQQQLALTAGEEDDALELDEMTELILDPSENRFRKKVASYSALGIKLTDIRIRTRKTRRHVDLKIECDNLANLARTDLLEGCMFALQRDADGNYTYTEKGVDSGEPSPVDMTNPQTVRLLSPILGGFKVEQTVKLPGRIIRTNAHRKGITTASWTYDLSRNQNAFVTYQRRNLVIVFDGQGLDLPDIRID